MNEKIQDASEVTGPLKRHSWVAMLRSSQLQFEGALYHAYTRGNRRERTYLDEADYKEFEDGLLDDADPRKDIALCLVPDSEPLSFPYEGMAGQPRSSSVRVLGEAVEIGHNHGIGELLKPGSVSRKSNAASGRA